MAVAFKSIVLLSTYASSESLVQFDRRAQRDRSRSRLPRRESRLGLELTYLAELGYTPSMVSKELVAASTVPLVLSVLMEGDTYGYALIQRVRTLSKDEIVWTEGMLYPVLHWMEDKGLIESEWREADSGRKRKYYRIAQPGRLALKEEKQQWLAVHTVLTKLWKTQPALT